MHVQFQIQTSPIWCGCMYAVFFAAKHPIIPSALLFQGLAVD